MTRDEMNGRTTKKMRGRAAITLALLLGAPMLAGCAGAFEADVSDSPLEPRVQALVDANREYPRWDEFPKASGDIPTAAQIAANVDALQASNASLSRDVARIDWQMQDAAAFEAQVRQQLDSLPPSPEALRTAEQLEAWAAEQRRLGEAPPPIPRRPQR